MSKFLFIFGLRIAVAFWLSNSTAAADAIDGGQAAATRWLSEMQKAVSGLSYKGEVAYLKNNEVDSFRLLHSSKDGLEQERLISMNTPLREVIRSAGQVVCYFPDKKSALVENNPASHATLFDLPQDASHLLKSYRLRLPGQEYVARRQAQVVSIEPQDSYRYGRLVWIDTDSKLPIKFETLDENGQTIEQMMFTSISIESSIPEKELEPTLRKEEVKWEVRDKETLPLEALNWSLHDVPAGFHIVSLTRMKRPSGDSPVEHILLSDGLSSVSVYIEPLKGSFREHPRKIGAINARTVQNQGYTVTVMGEVPAKTVDVIANGLKYQPKSSR